MFFSRIGFSSFLDSDSRRRVMLNVAHPLYRSRKDSNRKEMIHMIVIGINRYFRSSLGANRKREQSNTKKRTSPMIPCSN